jgi:hypothetical protein
VREGELARNEAGKRVRVRAVLKRELGAWAGDVARDLGMHAHWSATICGEGGADRAVPRVSESG